MNERITENLVRDKLRSLGYTKPDNGITIEEQKSEIAKVKSLLSKASKNSKGNAGYPEFIVSNLKDTAFLIVIECKSDVKKHESSNRDRPIEYAVDGVLHYARFLSKHYTVLAVAVSGSTLSNMKISNFLVPAESSDVKLLVNESEVVVSDILPYDDYYRLASFDPEVAKKRHSDLLDFSRELHELIWAKAKISEEDKPLLVSGTLIAFMDQSFIKTFESLPAEDLQQAWLDAIKRQLNKADIPKAKIDTMLQPYSTIAVHPNLGRPDSKTAKEYPGGVFKEIISRICNNVWPYISVYHDFDVVGQFYGEFLKYTAGDKKSLGIVLTPRHITELFSMLANVTPESKVLDICAGTGGFLISAMQHMLKKAVTDEERVEIKRNCLIGIENNPKMFALAASNMLLRGDGKANLHQASCFDESVVKFIKGKKPSIGMLNPPYSQSKSDAELHELYFVKQMLDCLKPGGVGIAIVPMSCAIVPNPVREELMKHHTLDAVMSMPQELFYPVGVVTCIMVWTAGVPHADSNLKTWFGYWRDDGFVKTKHRGRIDQNDSWPTIRDRWVETYRNREVHLGESTTHMVTADDEWCAEAYIETDYSSLTEEVFEADLKRFILFNLMLDVQGGASVKNEEGESGNDA
ncbi:MULTISPECIES: HsdM family class I SAM-dependent methyltransferase [Dethiosulfovibrio]|uniref:site-specific DNA-methyltransferase (adenine-specific) n=2 Tax=Dethiosulfovibrio TaxID=47054 RepID=A0ABS9EPL8_9BACT|nr:MULTISPECIES: N-6 DNA methylase [Dethiosulfovibrio]MCF4114466.1 SAM-dependent methyltransferase [Dethiosulfovibrio russensis]MCF4143143.1 SAM-dependent methyltransferase [Dethiosulfovibrio marinus]MCF4146184.1 SAM-dependent methyltransferase [Dethiosulfovibrio acidaminovorans]